MVQILEPNQRESFGSQIGMSLGKGIGGGFQESMSQRPQPDRTKKIVEALMGHGIPEDMATLVARAPEPEQNAFLKKIFQHQEPDYPGYKDSEQDQPNEFANKYEEAEPLEEEYGDLEEMLGTYQEPEYENEKPNAIFKDLDKYVANRNEEIGRDSKDAAMADKDRYDKNLPHYIEFESKRKQLSKNEQNYEIMSSVAKKLPKGISRINVDSDGNLRFPFLANAETQRFVKTLNEFAKGAKDTFGSRVTNFDLEQYMKTFPTLLNTKDGIKQIIKQMKIVNDIDKIHSNTLNDVFERAGGIRNIDYDVANRFAEKISKPKVDALVKKFGEIGTFDSLPEATQFKGKKIENKKTGEIFMSDGNEWVPQ